MQRSKKLEEVLMFKELSLKSVYNSNNENLSESFYTPVLREAVSFDRTSAYFSAKALASYANGLEYFGRNGNKYRLIVSKDISQEDYDEIKAGYELKRELRKEMLDALDEPLDIAEQRNISNLAFLIAVGIVELKMAFKSQGIFHDKSGVLEDENGDLICFHGSNNETEAAINNNYESFQLTCSWLDCNGFYKDGILKTKNMFENLWNNKVDGITVLDMDKVVLDKVMTFNKGELIIENSILEDGVAVMDYVGQLTLHLNFDRADEFVNSAFYKMKLKSKVEKNENNKVVYFKTDLVYTDYIKLGELIKAKSEKFDYGFVQTQRLLEYIDARNIYIRQRAKLGIELKTDDTNLQDKYLEFKRIVDDAMIRPLREKQMKDAFFMYAMAKSGNFSVPGSGKTASALGVYAFMQDKGIIDRIVMIGPKNSFESWNNEFVNTFGDKKILNAFSIQDKELSSKQKKKSELVYNNNSYNLFLFNYESLGSYVEELKKIVSRRTLLIFDEVHKVKMIGGTRAKAALEIASMATNIIAMTGTPIPNTYKDLYNFLHILFNDEYREFFGFDISYLNDPTLSEIEIINDKIQPFFCRTTKKELKVPDANDDISYYVGTSQDEQKVFDVLCQKYRKNKLALFIRILQLESNPRMLLDALDIEEFAKILDIEYDEELIDFVDYTDDMVCAIKNIDVTSKKRKCIDIIKSLVKNNKKVIVWSIFIDSIKSIQEILKKNGIEAAAIYGGVELEQREEILNSFRNGEYDVLITNPHTLAESVSLHSICHDAVYFEYSYNLVHLLQSKDRIHRLGLPENQYTQYHFLKTVFKHDGLEYSLDEKVYERLLEKEQTMLDAIENHILEPVYTSEEDLDLIFKSIE